MADAVSPASNPLLMFAGGQNNGASSGVVKSLDGGKHCTAPAYRRPRQWLLPGPVHAPSGPLHSHAAKTLHGRMVWLLCDCRDCRECRYDDH